LPIAATADARRPYCSPTRPSGTKVLTIDGKTERKRAGHRDQFAAELLYFSDCIVNDRIPEPSGEEGLQDVRIVQALYESAETGKAADSPLRAREAARHPSADRLSPLS
jgi:glucose-fructose oxidoreductase